MLRERERERQRGRGGGVRGGGCGQQRERKRRNSRGGGGGGRTGGCRSPELRTPATPGSAHCDSTCHHHHATMPSSLCHHHAIITNTTYGQDIDPSASMEKMDRGRQRSECDCVLVRTGCPGAWAWSSMSPQILSYLHASGPARAHLVARHTQPANRRPC